MFRPVNRSSALFEEIANVFSAFLGLFLAIIGFAVMLALATHAGQWLPILSASVYGTTLVLVYAASTLYHSVAAIDTVHKQAFRVVDHCAIYLMIAGSYTPFGMITLREDSGLFLLGFMWLMAAVGCAYKIFFKVNSGPVSTLTYVLMGSASLLVVQPLYTRLDPLGFYLVALGGLLYLIGVVVFIFDTRFLLSHALWHIFVLGGSMAHYLAVLFFVMPQLT